MIRSLKGLYHWLIAVFANLWFGFPSRRLTVIGVTGTDGKTTTATLIYEILKTAGYKTSLISSVRALVAGKSYDTGLHVTTPNAFDIQKHLREAVEHGDTHFVLEVTSHGVSQCRVWGINFAIGILTNVTPEHLDWHKTFAKYLSTKLKLLKWAKIAIINRDEAEVYDQAIQTLRQKKFITYGIRRKALISPQSYAFRTKLPGLFNQYNCLAALAVAESLGVKRKLAREAVANFAGLVGRMEVIQDQPFLVMVDFAHTPNALDKVLKTSRDLTKGRLIHVFGSAGLRDRVKRPKMGEVSAQYADLIVLTEEDYRTERVEEIMDEIARGIPAGKPVYRYPNRLEAIEFALKEAKPGDLVILTGKGHERSLCRGRIEYPWSDQKAVRQILKKTGSGKEYR